MSTKAREIEIHFNNEGNIGAITNPDGVQYDPVIGKTLLFREVTPEDSLNKAHADIFQLENTHLHLKIEELKRQNEIMGEALMRMCGMLPTPMMEDDEVPMYCHLVAKVALSKCGKGGRV